MQLPTPRPIFVTALLAAFAVSTAALWSSNLAYRSQCRVLGEHAQKLQKDLDTVESRQKNLILRLEKERNDLKTTFEAIKKDQESLQTALKKAEAEAAGANEEKTYLEDILIHKTKEIESLKGSLSPSLPEGGRDEEIRRLTEQNKILLERLGQFYKTANQKIAEINVAKIALDDTISTARKKIDDEWSTVNLGSIQVDASGKPKNEPTTERGGKSQGRVLAINEENGFVVVNLGRSDNIRPDTKLVVLKNGQDIATLSVLEIRDGMSAYNIQSSKDGQKIQVNDPVSVLPR